MTQRARHPLIPRVLIGYSLFLILCGVISFFTLSTGQAQSSYAAFVFAAVMLIWTVSIKQEKEWGFTMAIYTIILAMFAYFLRGFMFLLQVSQGEPDKLGLSIWGWIMSAGSVVSLFILFRLTMVKAPPRKPEI